jgi:hypothetical protein
MNAAAKLRDRLVSIQTKVLNQHEEIERLRAELAATRDDLQRARYAPLGDNHHNAAACPMCSPRLASAPSAPQLVRCGACGHVFDRHHMRGGCLEPLCICQGWKEPSAPSAPQPTDPYASMLELKENWDTHGAAPIDPRLTAVQLTGKVNE